MNIEKDLPMLTVGEMQEMYDKYDVKEYEEGIGIVKAHTHNVLTSHLLKIISKLEQDQKEREHIDSVLPDKPNENLVTKALEVIEDMSSAIGCSMQKIIPVTREDIGDIYCYAHIALGRCENKHKDWEDKLNKTYQELKDKS